MEIELAAGLGLALLVTIIRRRDELLAVEAGPPQRPGEVEHLDWRSRHRLYGLVLGCRLSFRTGERGARTTETSARRAALTSCAAADTELPAEVAELPKLTPTH